MIPADVLSSLKALALTQRPLVTAISGSSATTNFEPGQKFQATVQAQLAPGIFKVQVGEQLLQLQLPSNIRTGDTISLQVVSLLPRLTFNMAASANPLSTPDQLSETSRLLSSLTRQPLEKSYVGPSSSAPLWTGAAQFPDTLELADKLHNALSHSGLFYESHQAQWLAGSRNTAQLMQEPQNLKATGIPTQQQAFPLSDIPEHLQLLVQQQLHTLETRQVQWQGQVWLNQEMRWTVHEDPAHTANTPESQLWSTEIQLNLPKLGEVTATLSFGMGGLNIALVATETATRNALGKAASSLVSALTERGINVASTRINPHDQP